MTAQLKPHESASFDETTPVTMTSPADVSPLGVRIDVDELSRRVRVKRGELTLLDTVSFTIGAGELVAIVGPSGAGKTTLLEAIAGVAPATSGAVQLRRHRRACPPGDVPQPARLRAAGRHHPRRPAARPHAPLRRSAAAPVVDELGRRRRHAVGDALAAVGLTDHADVRVGSLSGGQRKRASIAVELLTDPHVFFLDEPTSGLDPVTSAELIARLRQLADRSATVVFTTHSIDDLALCDRIVFMTRGGRVGLRRDRRRGARAVRGQLGRRALPTPGRSRRRSRPRPAPHRRGRSPTTFPETRSGDRRRAGSRNGVS